MSMAQTFKIGVDVGGTFTDITLVGSDGTRHCAQDAVDAPGAGASRADRTRGGHATMRSAIRETVLVSSTARRSASIPSSGAIGARVGVLLTAGFEDILELGRCKMPDPFSLFASRPLPLARRNFVRGIRERIDGHGRVVIPLDVDALRTAAADLIALGAEVIAVSFLHAYRNPAHEKQARERLARCFSTLGRSRFPATSGRSRANTSARPWS